MKRPRNQNKSHKFYWHIKRRLAKKLIARIGKYAWKKLVLADNLKEGNIIHTCKGYNEVIEKIEPRAWFTKKGCLIHDLDIILVGGGSCSLQHCCTLPIYSKQEVFETWKRWADVPDGGWDFDPQHNALIKAIKNGEDPFDENGCVKEEYIVKPVPENGKLIYRQTVGH